MVAVVGEVKVMLIAPSFPSVVGALYVQEMHCPFRYRSRVAENVLFITGPEARYQMGEPAR